MPSDEYAAADSMYCHVRYLYDGNFHSAGFFQYHPYTELAAYIYHPIDDTYPIFVTVVHKGGTDFDKTALNVTL